MFKAHIVRWILSGVMVASSTLLSLPLSADTAVPDQAVPESGLFALADDYHLGGLPLITTASDTPYSPELLQALNQSTQYSRMAGNTPLGFTRDTVWLLLPVNLSADELERAGDYFLTFSRPDMDRVTMQLLNSDGIELALLRHGDLTPASQRAYKGNEIAFPLAALQANPETRYALFSMSGNSAINVELILRSESRLAQVQLQRVIGIVAFLAAMGALILYNGTILTLLRDRRYALYLGYAFAFCLYFATKAGVFVYFIPESVHLTSALEHGSATFAVAMLCLFIMSLSLQIHRSPVIKRLFTLFAYTNIICAPLMAVTAWLPYSLMALITFNLIFDSFFITALFVFALRGNVLDKLLFVSVLPTMSAALLLVLIQVGILPSYYWVEVLIPFLVVLEGLLLSSLLAYRFSALQKSSLLVKESSLNIQKTINEDLEMKVAMRTAQLNKALEARDEFLATMSHEIRTPLNGILGGIDLISDSNDPEEMRQHIVNMERSGKTLLSLINDVLDYSKIESGRMGINPEIFNLRDLLINVKDVFTGVARNNQNELYVDMADDIGWCLGDPVRVQQIVQNLVSNAVKYTEKGKVSIIAQRLESDSDQVCIEIKDTGIGISAEDQEHIFEHFSQGTQSAVKRKSGSGLGLAICKELTSLMDGALSVTSKPGEGSTFKAIVTLPVKAPPTAADKDSVYQIIPTCHLLIVDDNDINLTVATSLVEKLGHTSLTASNAFEAYALLRDPANEFDCILMDCEMPDVNGMEATRAIRQMQKNNVVPYCPIIALSAHTASDLTRECFLAGMDGFISKPIRRDSLQSQLADILYPFLQQRHENQGEN